MDDLNEIKELLKTNILPKPLGNFNTSFSLKNIMLSYEKMFENIIKNYETKFPIYRS